MIEEDYAQMNIERAALVRGIVQGYKQITLNEDGPIDSATVAELITDLLHLTRYIDQGSDPIESTLRKARNNFNAEVLEEETNEPQ